MDASDMGVDLNEILLTAEQIDARLSEMAAQIDADYEGRDLLLVGVLNGAVMAMADLARKLHNRANMDWMAVSSYGSGTKSSGVVRILKDLGTDIHDRHVLIVEDIIDSGLTLQYLTRSLKARNPASLEVVTLLSKPARRTADLECRYTGFEIPDEFVVGYGLDYAEKYRNMPYLGVADEPD